MSEGSKPPPKGTDAPVPSAPAVVESSPGPQKPTPSRRSVPFEDETMVGLTPIKPLEAGESNPAPKKKAVDEKTMMHISSSPRPPRGAYDDETMRALKPIEATPAHKFVDETMLLVALSPAAESPFVPVMEPAIAEVVPHAVAVVAEPVLEVPTHEPTYPAAKPVTRATARFDPTMTAGLVPIAEPPSALAMAPAPAPLVDTTRTSFVSPISLGDSPASTPTTPPEPRGTVEAIAAALGRKHRLDVPQAPTEPATLTPSSATPVGPSLDLRTPERPILDGPRAPFEQPGRLEAPVPPRAKRQRAIGDPLPILHQTKFAPFVMNWRLRPPKDAIVVVVKATARFVDGKAATLIDAQPPSGDVFSDSALSGSLRYPSDFSIFKPRADVLLTADAHVPKGNTVGSVRFRIGNHSWQLAVVGNRLWGGSTPTQPEPFATMPLTWEHALGGALSTENPAGRGYRTGTLLPNLERPEQLIVGKRDTPRPICFAPVSPQWRSRASRVGRYDRKWLESRWPFLPEDFDFAYFNAAPSDLQVPYPQGDEPFDVTGVQPGGSVLDGRLPGRRPFVYAQRTSAAGGELLALHMNLDTVLIDAKAGIVTLVWRGLLEVEDRDALDLEAIFVEEGPVGRHDDLAGALGRFHALRASRGLVINALLDAAAADNEVALGSALGQSVIDEAKSGRRPLPTSLIRRRRPRRAPPARPVPIDTVVEWLADGRSLAGLDLTGADLCEVDLRGRDLTGAILTDAQLEGACFDGCACAGMIASNVAASDTSWVGADLTKADFTGARLGRANFTDAKLTRVIARNVVAPHAKLDRVDADGAVFTDALLDDASFVGAKLAKADFSTAKLARANFTRATMPDVKFYEVEGDGVVLDGADLTDARMEGATLIGLSARGVAATGSLWNKSNVSDATFEGAELQDASFVAAVAKRTIFNKVGGRRASFRGAILGNAYFLKSDLSKVSFEQADLRDADMRGAVLDEAETWEANLKGVDLRQASTLGTKLGVLGRKS